MTWTDWDHLDDAANAAHLDSVEAAYDIVEDSGIRWVLIDADDNQALRAAADHFAANEKEVTRS